MRILTALLSLLPAAAFAGTATLSTTDSKGKDVQPQCMPAELTSFSATTDYGFHRDMKRGGGNIEVEHNAVELDERIPLNLMAWPNLPCGQWYLRAGAAYERFDFSLHNTGPLPDTLQSISGVIAFEYLVNGHPAIVLESHPGVYFQHNINGGAFDAPTSLYASIPIHDDNVYLILGAEGSLLARWPVVPIAGLLWHINDKWDLQAYLPDPRLVYQFSDKLSFFAGGELVGGGFKTDNRNVSPKKLSGAIVTYDEIRAGGGFTWEVKPVTLEVAGGYVVQSEFDYSRAGESYSTHPAPYVRVSARLDF